MLLPGAVPKPLIQNQIALGGIIFVWGWGMVDLFNSTFILWLSICYIVIVSEAAPLTVWLQISWSLVILYVASPLEV